MKSPIESFFNLGNKVTGGNPVRKAQFDYYLYWILALAFFTMMVNNFRMFYLSGFTQFNYLAWGLVMGVITWFNYHALTAFRNGYVTLKKINQKSFESKGKDEKNEELEIESFDEMLNEFGKKDGS